jgi:hypothetical protein
MRCRPSFRGYVTCWNVVGAIDPGQWTGCFDRKLEEQTGDRNESSRQHKMQLPHCRPFSGSRLRAQPRLRHRPSPDMDRSGG